METPDPKRGESSLGELQGWDMTSEPPEDMEFHKSSDEEADEEASEDAASEDEGSDEGDSE